MGIFSKLKKGLGIGTASVAIDVKNSHLIESGSIPGTATITAESDLHFTKIKFSVIRETTSGKRSDSSKQSHTIGEMIDSQTFDMKEGESKTVEFNIPIEKKVTMTEAIQAGSASFGGLGKIAGQLLTSKKVNYFVKVVADAEGVALDPSAKEQIDIFFDVEKYKNAIREKLSS